MSVYVHTYRYSFNLAPSLCERKKRQLHEKLEHMVEHQRGIDVLLLALICDDDKDMDVSNYLLDFLEGTVYTYKNRLIVMRKIYLLTFHTDCN